MVERQEIIREIVINNFKSIYSMDYGVFRFSLVYGYSSVFYAVEVLLGYILG